MFYKSLVGSAACKNIFPEPLRRRAFSRWFMIQEFCAEEGPLMRVTLMTYSRSERHDGHLLVEPAQALQLPESSNGASILDTITEELTQHLHLLP